jgi:hypothetical protein
VGTFVSAVMVRQTMSPGGIFCASDHESISVRSAKTMSETLIPLCGNVVHVDRPSFITQYPSSGCIFTIN